MSIKNLSEKVEIKQEPLTVSDSWKVDRSIISFSILRFAPQCLKDLE